MSAIRGATRDDRGAAPRPLRRLAQPPVGTAIKRAKPTWEKPYQRRIVVTDTLILAGTLVGTQAVWIGIDSHTLISAPQHGFNQVPYWAASLVLLIGWLIVLKAIGTRSPRVIGSGFAEYARVADGSFRLFGLVGITSLLLQFLPARGYIITAFPVGVLLLVASRWAWRQWLRAQRRKGRYLIRILLVGSPSSVAHLHEEFSRRKYLGFQMVGACLPQGVDAPLPVRRLGSFATVAEVARRERVHAVSLAGSEDLPPGEVRRIGWKLESTGVDLMVAPAITEVAGTRIHTRPVPGIPLMYVESPSYEGGKKFAKSLLDFGIAWLALLLASPLMLGTAIAVKLSSPGPVFFRQQRIGLNGKAFGVFKFRSMRVGADAELPELLRAQGTEDTPLFKVDNDPRITPAGRFIRKYSLDELPQLINVIRGEMSLVGPRPQRAEEVALYDHAAGRRLLVKPGITGLWQVSGRSNLSWEDTIRMDLYYAENWSFLDDFVILLWTIRTVLQSKGAR
ncbi:sugar transferase [Amnibacterium sp.]|uniref:sugar transferase n=1 Tax=Amnibacterium sp. TaxID=1872496 RepID=UPI00262F6B48|nr:sugar transferase [Amnibacterium sp.]MCU1473168.1 sugar transferase [Amnibacterium sp.]